MDTKKLFEAKGDEIAFTKKDIFGLAIFLLIPFTFFATDFIGKYRIVYYAVLVIFVAVYTIVGQFFFEGARLGSQGKRLLALTVINTLVTSFVVFTDNLSSLFFFVLYYLLFSVAIFTPIWIFVLECLVIFASVAIVELYSAGSISLMIQGLSTSELINLISIPIALPLMVAISSFVKGLEIKRRLLSLSRDLLAIEDIEDEALLAEIDQGIIILDPDLVIVKISRWVEINFGTTSQVLLGRKITDLDLYDAVTNKKLLPSDRFYKNLESPSPQTLKWRILYKNVYGKFNKFVVKQTPLIVADQVIGTMLSIQHPPKTLGDIITSFNQLLSFRLASSIAMIKNLMVTSSKITSDPSYPNIKRHLDITTQLLNDVSIKNEIADGNYEITLTKFDLDIMLKNVIHRLQSLGKVTVWNISPVYKNKPLMLKSDAPLCERLFEYSFKGALYLAKNKKLNLSVDEDEIQKRPTIALTSEVVVGFPQEADLLEPFFAGKLMILAKYKGSGLELSNANLIAGFLGFDYSAQVRNNKLILKIIFK